MIHFTKKIELGELYSKWVIENHLQDCPATVIHFLQVKGLLNEEKTHQFLAVKTNTVIDGTSNSSNHYVKEDINMAENKDKVVDLSAANGGSGVPDKPKTEPDKEFFLKRWAKAAWKGACKFGKAVKESPFTHVAATGIGVAGTIVVEEALRRKFSRTADEDYDDQEPIEIEDNGEVDDVDENLPAEDDETETE